MEVPDLTDPRYLDEVGWFLQYEEYVYGPAGGSYEQERIDSSARLRAEIQERFHLDDDWFLRATVVSVGAGCTGDLAAWPAAVKIAVDPLLEVYDRLGMLIRDVEGTSATVYLSVGVEGMPLISSTCDLLLCRNAFDHMPDPASALEEMWRVLKPNGLLFLSVDIGGEPTPDEPTVFTAPNLMSLFHERFDLIGEPLRQEAHSAHRDFRLTILARKNQGESQSLDRKAILSAYQDRVEEKWGPGSVERDVRRRDVEAEPSRSSS